jgi:hypothetical protein
MRDPAELEDLPDEERLPALKSALAVLAASRKQYPAEAKVLDRTELGQILTELDYWFQQVGPMVGHLAEQYLVVAKLAGHFQDDNFQSQLAGKESTALARKELAWLKALLDLKAQGAPDEWAEVWVNRGS